MWSALSKSRAGIWWYRALHSNIYIFLSKYLTRHDGNILDAGCGSGALGDFLKNLCVGARITNIDVSEAACDFVKRYSDIPICRASIEVMPFQDEEFDVIICTDVLCQAGVDDRRAIREAWRCLRQSGIYIVNLPAYAWLFSSYDRIVNNARRYRLKDACQLLESEGFHIYKATHWNSILFPLMVARRKLFAPNMRNKNVDFFAGDAFLPVVLWSLLAIERMLLSVGVSLPFGGSILIVAYKA